MTSGKLRVFLWLIPFFISLNAFAEAWDTLSHCPNSTDGNELSQWRDLYIQQKTNGNLKDEPFLACFPKEVPACLKRVKSYSEKDLLKDAVITDAKSSDDPKRQIPSELLLPPFDPKNIRFNPDAEKIAKQKGWPAVRFKTRHSGGFDTNTSSFLMIEIPGASLDPKVGYDRYLNISLPESKNENPEDPIPSRNLPAFSEYKSQKNGALPTNAAMMIADRGPNGSRRLLFQKYSRDEDTYSYNAVSDPKVYMDCYSCHSSGLRALSPLGYSVNDGERQMPISDWKTVKKINDDMLAFAGVPSFGTVQDKNGNLHPAIDPDRYGPVYGPSNPHTRVITKGADGKEKSESTRSKTFIVGESGNGGCAVKNPKIFVPDIMGRKPGMKNIYEWSSNPPVDWAKVADAMDCESCHNGQKRGVLTGQTKPELILYKILVDKSMPYHAHQNPLDQGSPTAKVQDELNLNERIALANCLMVEFDSEKTKIKEWLVDPSCYEEDATVIIPKQLNRFGKQDSCGKTSDGI